MDRRYTEKQKNYAIETVLERLKEGMPFNKAIFGLGITGATIKRWLEQKGLPTSHQQYVESLKNRENKNQENQNDIDIEIEQKRIGVQVAKYELLKLLVKKCRIDMKIDGDRAKKTLKEAVELSQEMYQGGIDSIEILELVLEVEYLKGDNRQREEEMTRSIIELQKETLLTKGENPLLEDKMRKFETHLARVLILKSRETIVKEGKQKPNLADLVEAKEILIKGLQENPEHSEKIDYLIQIAKLQKDLVGLRRLVELKLCINPYDIHAAEDLKKIKAKWKDKPPHDAQFKVENAEDCTILLKYEATYTAAICEGDRTRAIEILYQMLQDPLTSTSLRKKIRNAINITERSKNIQEELENI